MGDCDRDGFIRTTVIRTTGFVQRRLPRDCRVIYISSHILVRYRKPAAASSPRSSFYVPPQLCSSMSALNLTAGYSNGQSQDATLPLQPIPASHPANHRANVATGSEEKGGLPMPGEEEPSTARPESVSENAAPPEVPNTAVEMAETGGYPLQRYPGATEAEMDAPWADGRTSRAGQRWDEDPSADLNSRALSPQYADVFDAEDERMMIAHYICNLHDGKIWPSTRFCGQAPIVRRRGVACTLHEELLHNLFGSAVNDATAAMGGPPYYDVPPIYEHERERSVGVTQVAEKGDIHALCNVQHSRALPFHYDDGSRKEEEEEEEATEEVSVFESDEEEADVAAEFGDPEAEEWDGEYDETETF